MALAIAIAAARIEAQITAAEWKRFAARQAAQDGLDYAAWRIAAVDRGETDALASYVFEINGYEVRFARSPESEKLDINLAGETRLSSFFRVLGMEPEEADKFAARIADWRDEDDLSRPNGAEARDYANARNGEKISDRPFYSADELALVLDAPQDIVSCALPALTIFGDGAPPSASLMQRLYGASTDQQEAPTRARLGTASRSAAAGRRYAITAAARKADGETSKLHELTGVFRITGGRERPYEWIAQFEGEKERSVADRCKKADENAEQLE